jgi:antibiotic biosynthesis monooxygenase (ABM) superfamily enzyme
MLEHSKPQAKKTVAKTNTKSAQSGKTSTKKAPSRQKQTTSIVITSAQRQQMIEEAAYFIAQHQGFTAHSPLDYWLMAESEIDQQLSRQVR